jgi:RHS repeat-associated protein
MIFEKKQSSAKLMRMLFRRLTLGLLFASAHAFAQSTGTVTYVYTDPQGTPLAETDASGNITATFEYTPYGTYAPQGTSTPGPTPNGPGYTSHVNDPETNLVYMQARYYDPATGHFLSKDPIKPTTGNDFNFNRYAYAQNNPILNTDPTGACVGGNSGQDSPCNPSPGSSPTPPPKPQNPAPPVSSTVQKMRDTSDRQGPSSNSGPDKVGFSFSGLLVGTPSVSASGIAAAGGGIQAQKSLYKDEDKVGIVTPALGLSASVDAKIFQVTYKGSNAQEGPVSMTAGGEVSLHEVLGGRLSVGYSPPSTFQLTLDGGVGAGAAFHVYSVDWTPGK